MSAIAGFCTTVSGAPFHSNQTKHGCTLAYLLLQKMMLRTTTKNVSSESQYKYTVYSTQKTSAVHKLDDK